MIMSFLSRLFGSGSSTATVEPTSTSTFTPVEEQFYDTQPDVVDSPALPPLVESPPADPHRIPVEPDTIQALLKRDHAKAGYEDGFTTASSRLREEKVQALRVEMEAILRDYDMELQGFISRHGKDIQRMDQETDHDVILDVQELIDEALRRRQFIDNEIVRMNIHEGRIATAVNAYKQGFQQGLKDRYAAGSASVSTENTAQ